MLSTEQDMRCDLYAQPIALAAHNKHIESSFWAKWAQTFRKLPAILSFQIFSIVWIKSSCVNTRMEATGGVDELQSSRVLPGMDVSQLWCMAML